MILRASDIADNTNYINYMDAFYGRNKVDSMKHYIEDNIISASDQGFYRAIIYLGHCCSEKEIEDILKCFESLGYGCFLDRNILTIVW